MYHPFGSHKESASTLDVSPSPPQSVDETTSKLRYNWENVVKNFTPAWFAVNMGTGITAILLERLPYQFTGLHYIAITIFALNAFLFCIFLALTIVRYLVYPSKFPEMLRHPVQSLFTGMFPMGFATLVNLTVYICVPAWGSKAVTLAWVMWWVDVVLSFATCFCIPFLLTSVHETRLDKMTAAWLLPIVAPIVAAASGGIVAEVLENPNHQIITVIVSYILWGTGVPLAMCVLVVYFQRLAFHKLPAKEVIVSVLLPLGPLGQGSFGVMQLGKVARTLFPKIDFLSPLAGEMFYCAGTLLALIMWGFALVWCFFAIATLMRGRFPFNLGWWAFTFPLGVFTTATTSFGSEFNSPFFSILGTIFSCMVTALWLVVFSKTAWKSVTGELFK